MVGYVPGHWADAAWKLPAPTGTANYDFTSQRRIRRRVCCKLARTFVFGDLDNGAGQQRIVSDPGI